MGEEIFDNSHRSRFDAKRCLGCFISVSDHRSPNSFLNQSQIWMGQNEQNDGFTIAELHQAACLSLTVEVQQLPQINLREGGFSGRGLS